MKKEEGMWGSSLVEAFGSILFWDTFPTREAFDLGVQRTTISKSIAAKGALVEKWPSVQPH
jgi:hypothetical protein